MQWRERVSRCIEDIEEGFCHPGQNDYLHVEQDEQIGMFAEGAAPQLSEISAEFPNRLFVFGAFGRHIATELMPKFNSADLTELLVLYQQFHVEHIARPYQLVGAETFKDCHDFVFFEKFRFQLLPGEFMPRFSVQINTPNDIDRPSYYHDVSRNAQLFLNNIGCRAFAPNSNAEISKINFSIYYPVLHLLRNAFLLKYFPRCALNGFLPALLEVLENSPEFYDHQEQVYWKKRGLNYWRHRAVNSLVIVLRQCTSKRLSKMLPYESEGSVASFLHSGSLINQPENTEAVEIWLRGNLNIARYMLFPRKENFLEFPNLSYFSQKRVMQQYGLLDAKSFRVIHQLKPTIFNKYFGHSFHTAALPLFCLAHTRHKHLNTYCLLPLLNRFYEAFHELDMGVDQKASPDLTKEAINIARKLSIAFDLGYEILAEIWQRHKRNNTQFYLEALHCGDLHSLIDYIRVCNVQRPPLLAQGNVQRPVLQLSNFPHLAGLNQSTTRQSLARHIQQWHATLAEKSDKVEFVDYEIPVREFDLEDYRFTPVGNSVDLHAEGASMHHCVFSFNAMVLKRKYLVFQVRSLDLETGKPDGIERATLGLNLIHLDDSAITLAFHQCYKKHNAAISLRLKALMFPVLSFLHDQHYNDLCRYAFSSLPEQKAAL